MSDALQYLITGLGTGCAYDGGAHTEPYYLVSGYLIYFTP